MRNFRRLVLGLLLVSLAGVNWGEEDAIPAKRQEPYVFVELPNGKTVQVPQNAPAEMIKDYAMATGLATQKDYDDAAKRKVQKRIYNACLIDKGEGVDMTVQSLEEAVQAMCSEISEQPSFIDRWKYE